MAERIPTSRVLGALLDEATTERVSLGWLMDRLGERSFGIILLLLAFLALIPGVSPVAGIL
ncbi:MAG: exopolysaccharide biosynthesis protein, partial [Alphaproteobacteria bacterium]